MGIEANTGPSDQTIEKMDKTWPLGTDTRSFWDDHARFIKAVLKNIFPGVGGNGFSIPITATEAEINQLHGVSLATKLVTPKVDTNQAANVASAATIDLENIAGETVTITGTTTITAITLGQGHTRIVVFSDALVLTNGINLVLPGNASITTAAGDVAVFSAFGTGGTTVRCISYTSATKKIVAGKFTRDTSLASGTQVISGLGFVPTSIRFYITNDYDSSTVIGIWDGTNNFVNAINGGSPPANQSLYFYKYTGVGNSYYGNVSAAAYDQFTISWTRSNLPSGILSILWEAIG